MSLKHHPHPCHKKTYNSFLKETVDFNNYQKCNLSLWFYLITFISFFSEINWSQQSVTPNITSCLWSCMCVTWTSHIFQQRLTPSDGEKVDWCCTCKQMKFWGDWKSKHHLTDLLSPYKLWMGSTEITKNLFPAVNFSPQFECVDWCQNLMFVRWEKW